MQLLRRGSTPGAITRAPMSDAHAATAATTEWLEKLWPRRPDERLVQSGQLRGEDERDAGGSRPQGPASLDAMRTPRPRSVARIPPGSAASSSGASVAGEGRESQDDPGGDRPPDRTPEPPFGGGRLRHLELEEQVVGDHRQRREARSERRHLDVEEEVGGLGIGQPGVVGAVGKGRHARPRVETDDPARRQVRDRFELGGDHAVEDRLRDRGALLRPSREHRRDMRSSWRRLLGQPRSPRRSCDGSSSGSCPSDRPSERSRSLPR